MIHLIEGSYDLFTAPDGSGKKSTGHGWLPVKLSQLCSAEVQPVNAPWIFVIRSIGMFNIAWQDEEFVGMDLVGFVSQCEPSFSIGAIDEKVFGKSFFPVSVMPGSMRIITEAADKKAGHEFVRQDIRFQNTFWYLDALPSFSVPDIFVRSSSNGCHCCPIIN